MFQTTNQRRSPSLTGQGMEKNHHGRAKSPNKETMCQYFQVTKLVSYMEVSVSSWRGTPSHHPFIDRIFHYISLPAIGEYPHGYEKHHNPLLTTKLTIYDPYIIHILTILINQLLGYPKMAMETPTNLPYTFVRRGTVFWLGEPSSKFTSSATVWSRTNFCPVLVRVLPKV